MFSFPCWVNCELPVAKYYFFWAISCRTISCNISRWFRRYSNLGGSGVRFDGSLRLYGSAGGGWRALPLRAASGYKGVSKLSNSNRFKADLRDTGYRGVFNTAEEAALAYARHVGPEAAAAAATEPTAAEALQQARAEGLQLVGADNASGFKGVCLHGSSFPCREVDRLWSTTSP